MAAVRTLSSILYTEDQKIIDMIVDQDYYSRVHQVIDRSLGKPSHLSIDMIKDALWGLSNMVTSDQQISRFFLQEQELALLVFKLALLAENSFLRSEGSYVILNSLSTCLLDTLI